MLPRFTYHPNPIETGSIVPSDEVCECCGIKRGYVYCTVPYGEVEYEYLCPWCIADGSAHEKLGVEFSDSWPLEKANVPQHVIEQVSFRTPGYLSWQQENWLACCNDACEYHGDAPAAELQALDSDGLINLSRDTGFSVEDLIEIVKHYQPKGSPAFYKFVCRHCRTVRYSADCD
jgi:uncharacterized protein CbrC (UPF0167 family)